MQCSRDKSILSNQQRFQEKSAASKHKASYDLDGNHSKIRNIEGEYKNEFRQIAIFRMCDAKIKILSKLLISQETRVNVVKIGTA
jgi:hypothetical protein